MVIYRVLRAQKTSSGTMQYRLRGTILGKPKAKKRRHVQILRERDDELALLLTSGRGADDSVLIRKLREFGKSRCCD